MAENRSLYPGCWLARFGFLPDSRIWFGLREKACAVTWQGKLPRPRKRFLFGRSISIPSPPFIPKSEPPPQADGKNLPMQVDSPRFPCPSPMSFTRNSRFPLGFFSALTAIRALRHSFSERQSKSTPIWVRTPI